MTRQHKQPQMTVRNPAYRQAFQRLDESLEQNSDFSYAEQIQLLGRQMFGDLWDDPEETGTAVLPK